MRRVSAFVYPTIVYRLMKRRRPDSPLSHLSPRERLTVKRIWARSRSALAGGTSYAAPIMITDPNVPLDEITPDLAAGYEPETIMVGQPSPTGNVVTPHG